MAEAPARPVAIARCRDYEAGQVQARLAELFDQIGGIRRLVQGKTVAVKLNLVGDTGGVFRGARSERAYQVHPSVALALARLLKEAGARRIRFLESGSRREPFYELLPKAGWDLDALRAAGGTVEFDGRDVSRLPASAIARRGLALVPQWRELFPNFSVEETLAAGARAAVGRAPRPIEEVFELFPRLAERKRQLAGSLSGGEQQMLTLARALVSNPKLMLLDEPSAGLAVGIVATLVETINRIRGAGISILLVEQNVEIARSVADRCVVFSVGELVWRGDVSEALRDGELQRAYFGAH